MLGIVNCCVCPVHTTMVIMALVYRFDDIGSACAMKDTVYDAEGNSFLEDGLTFSLYSILGMSFWIVYTCCAGCATFDKPEKN